MSSNLNDVEADEKSFNSQLDFLKLELESINTITGRIDGITQTIKNWCVVVWAGSIALLIANEKLNLIIFTVVLPILFWYVDAWWRRIQRSFVFRSMKISEFLNSDRFVESFRKKRLIDFIVLDPKGRQYKNLPEYQRFRSLRVTLRFRDVGGFYFGLMMISIVSGIILGL